MFSSNHAAMRADVAPVFGLTDLVAFLDNTIAS